jgi:hypothetical protein
VLGCRLGIRPGCEVRDAARERRGLQRPGFRPGGHHIVDVVAEQQLAGTGDPFQDPDGGNDRADGDSGHLTLDAGRIVVAVIVGGGLVFPAADDVPSGLVRVRVRAAAIAQSQNYW